ncbi:MAG: rhodanese-like domain-containing protein, partial [Pseudomonadota bacterium]
AGEAPALRGFLERLRAAPGFAALEHKESWSAAPPFPRLKVRVKREIVSMGAPGSAVPGAVAPRLGWQAWNAVLARAGAGALVVDVRNDYETRLGAFEGATDPETATFRAFPEWAARRLPELRAAEVVATYCTGGVRCEKATAHLRGLGLDNVVQLDGGVLKYLETAPQELSRWRGHCFVFDERVSVGPSLAPGPHTLCRGCRRPVAPEDMADPRYVPGVSCPACAQGLSPARRRGLAERQRQIKLARARGARHLGGGAG